MDRLTNLTMRAAGMYGLLSEILSNGALWNRYGQDDDLQDRIAMAVADHENATAYFAGLPAAPLPDVHAAAWMTPLLATAEGAYDAAAKVSGSALLAGETPKAGRAEQQRLIYEQACIALRGLFCVVDELKTQIAAPGVKVDGGAQCEK